jgi:hypothetical protein
MTEHEKWLEDLVGELKKPVTERPERKARIMERIRATPPARSGRIAGALGAFLEWLVRRRTIAVSPLAAAVCALVVLAAFVLGVRMMRPHVSIDRDEARRYGTHVVAREEAVRLALAARPGESLVKFVLKSPEASRVAVIGDFNNWDPGASVLRQEGTSGLWTVIVPLPAGRHEYAFIVDGEYWLPDPNAPRTPKDDFDRMNSIMLIGGQVN